MKYLTEKVLIFARLLLTLHVKENISFEYLTLNINLLCHKSKDVSLRLLDR